MYNFLSSATIFSHVSENCEQTVFEFDEANKSDGFSDDDIELHVVVPEGLIVARLKSNPMQVLWQKKVRSMKIGNSLLCFTKQCTGIFSSSQMGSAIAKAWTLRCDQLQSVDLFDAKHIPALLQDDTHSHSDDVSGSDVYQPEVPALYVGKCRRAY